MQTSVSKALTLDPTRGGWVKEDIPSLVLTYDSSRPEHASLLKNLAADHRFVAAAHLFNCFRVDRAAPEDAARTDAVLGVYRRDGTLIAQIHGSARIRGAFKLLARGMKEDRGLEMQRLLPRAKSALTALARIKAYLREITPRLVDARTGRLDEKTRNTIARARAVAAQWSKVLEVLKG